MIKIQLVNQSGYHLDRFQIASPGSIEWSPNYLKSTLKSGNEVEIELPQNKTIIDIEVHYEGYDEANVNRPVWTNIDLSKVNRLTLQWEKEKGISTLKKTWNN